MRSLAILWALLIGVALTGSMPLAGATTRDRVDASPVATGTTMTYDQPPRPLVYGGFDAENPGWIVALFKNGGFACTGALIHAQVVLTAAHCVDEPGNYSVLIDEEWLYSAGLTRSVKTISIHPGWGGEFNDTDLALLGLDTPVTTVPLATLNTTGLWPEQSQNLAIAGWGQYESDSPPSEYLQAADVYATSGMDGTIDPSYCDLDATAATIGGMFCFGGPVTAGVCPGDSGGPVVGWSSPTATDGTVVIYGLVSYGSPSCGPSAWDSVAQSVGGHHAWIQSQIQAITQPHPTAEAHSIGLVDPAEGLWHLYDETGVQTTQFYFGNPGDYPILGDWNCDGVETPGMYRQTDGYVYLRNTNTQGPGDIRFFFGNPGDIPITGDFNGDGCATVSIYRPANQTFYIINKLGANDGELGAAQFSYVFGDPGDKPFVGDFDGDGIETVGLHRESTGLVYFRNSHTQGNAESQFIYGDPGDRLIAGDWNKDGKFSPALFRPSNTTMYFRYTNTAGNADAQFIPGPSGSEWLPVSGTFE